MPTSAGITKPAEKPRHKSCAGQVLRWPRLRQRESGSRGRFIEYPDRKIGGCGSYSAVNLKLLTVTQESFSPLLTAIKASFISQKLLSFKLIGCKIRIGQQLEGKPKPSAFLSAL